jgi:hypothetical protein
MTNQNGNVTPSAVTPNLGKNKTEKDRLAALEGEVERLGGALDRAISELRDVRRKLEETNARKRTGDI